MGVALAIVGSLLSLFYSGGGSYLDTITYRVYDSDGSLRLWKAGEENFTSLACSRSGNLSFVFTGWNENEETTWLPEMISNLQTFRGGCIVVPDYWVYTNNADYFAIVPHYAGIESAVLAEVLAFQADGFTAGNTFFVGFSFGSQVALGVGRDLPTKIKRIDVCEPTMMGFLLTPDSKLSAENVQCIHTNSNGFGTSKRDCHQDWNMGECGNSQAAAGDPPMGNHGLCPHIYNSAFRNDFPATGKPWYCLPVFYFTSWPTGFKMGFQETRTTYTGQFFAQTTKNPSYN